MPILKSTMRHQRYGQNADDAPPAWAPLTPASLPRSTSAMSHPPPVAATVAFPSKSHRPDPDITPSVLEFDTAPNGYSDGLVGAGAGTGAGWQQIVIEPVS